MRYLAPPTRRRKAAPPLVVRFGQQTGVDELLLAQAALHVVHEGQGVDPRRGVEAVGERVQPRVPSVPLAVHRQVLAEERDHARMGQYPRDGVVVDRPDDVFMKYGRFINVT